LADPEQGIGLSRRLKDCTMRSSRGKDYDNDACGFIMHNTGSLVRKNTQLRAL